LGYVFKSENCALASTLGSTFNLEPLMKLFGVCTWKVKVWFGGLLKLANAKFTHEFTNLAISLLVVSQFQTLLLQSFKKVHNFFLNDSITYNFFFPYMDLQQWLV